MNRFILIILFVTCIFFTPKLCYCQVEWEQQIDGWIDDVYWPYLFLGGAYYTRISLVDIDKDSDLDMFYGGGDTGTLVYFENTGNREEPIFTLRYEEYPGLRHPTKYGGTADVDFADLDNDEDLDALHSPELLGSGMIFWNDGTAQEPEFVRRPPYNPTFGQCNPTLVDIDNDGDYDYFSGHGYHNYQLIFAENTGSPEYPHFEWQTNYYQDIDLGLPFNFDLGDIDLDGDYDLIVCKHGGNVAYYENTGTPSEPLFTHVTDSLFPDRDTTDWMETPELADIDGDGDLDLFLAGGYAHLYYFENLSISDYPHFIERYDTSLFFVIPGQRGALLGNSVDIDGDGDDDIAPGNDLFLNESADGQIKFSRVPDFLPIDIGSFADIDADGDFDYVIPGGIYALRYSENIGDSSWPVWDSIQDLFPADGHLFVLRSVATGDLDNDGDQDILVSHDSSSSLTYYRNDGDPENYDFTYVGDLDLPQWENRGIKFVVLEDIDNDNDLDLLIGEVRFGWENPVRLTFYRNDGTPEEPLWTYVTDDFQNVISEHRNSSIAPCLADIDMDGDKDLVVTNNSIGMQLFFNPMIQTDIEYTPQHMIDFSVDTANIQIFPNPSNSMVSISFEIKRSMYLQVEIYNILGQSIDTIYEGLLTEGKHSYLWDSSDCSSGIYFIKLNNSKRSYYSKFTIIK